VVLKNLSAAADTKVTLLGHEGELKFKSDDGNIVVEWPNLDPQNLPFAHAYTLKLTGVK